ncbi:CLUMA_CG014873, isoform A [Clunio marinus]|uniref:CLUMA_CG014873, isoform A n=1 Tax=Clunio marinus TaxID=568069 RepID=A0A1J1IPK8_9DIPT|nr:CLUMA_CG014873, isoform A [Clunio marinus]
MLLHLGHHELNQTISDLFARPKMKLYGQNEITSQTFNRVRRKKIERFALYTKTSKKFTSTSVQDSYYSKRNV